MHHGKKNIFGRHLFRSHVSGIPILPQVAFVVSRRHAAFSSMCESGLKGYARAFTHELVKITDFPCGAARRHVAGIDRRAWASSCIFSPAGYRVSPRRRTALAGGCLHFWDPLTFRIASTSCFLWRNFLLRRVTRLKGTAIIYCKYDG